MNSHMPFRLRQDRRRRGAHSRHGCERGRGEGMWHDQHMHPGERHRGPQRLV